MALSAATPRNYSPAGRRNSLPMKAATTIYAGGALSMDAGGEIGPITAGEKFVGFAVKTLTNSGAAGAMSAEVIADGEVGLTVTSLDDNNDLGDVVYATDDNTFTLSASGSAVAIGRVSQIESLATNKGRVRFASFIHEHPLD